MSYQIKPGCVGCHYCALECPVGAIRIRGVGYQIDEDSCISCGRCASVCHLSLPYDKLAPVETPVPHEKENLQCDVLVIGAGGVGIGAAARAAWLGLDVILIEAAERFGGGTYLAHGASFPGSKTVYPRLGLDSSIDGQVNFWNMVGNGKVQDQEQLRINVAANGAFLDWFDSLDPDNCSVFRNGGERFPFPFDLPHRYLNTKSTDNSIGPGWTGSWITEKLFDACMKYGVRYRNRTRARKFIQNDSGAVTAVLAQDPGGEVEISAKAFVLATGNYLMDDEALNAIDPNYVRGDMSILRLTVPTNRGDGQRMVRELGGIVDTSFMRTRGPAHHPYCYAVNQFMMNRENVFFGGDGVRLFEQQFGPPSLPGQRAPETPDTPGQIILHTESGSCYLIMDSEQLESYGAQLLERADPIHDDFAPHWRDDIEAECALEDRPARKAETIRELASKLGMDPARLEASVAHYNELCAKGCDEDFGKPAQFMRPIQKAPFYAFIGQNFENGASLGGVSTDERFRVLNQKGGVFRGLYCAGDCATYSPENNEGAIGLCGGLGGSWASGWQIANYIAEELKAN